MATILICDMCKHVISSGMPRYKLTSKIDTKSVVSKKKPISYELTICENCSKKIQDYILVNTTKFQ